MTKEKDKERAFYIPMFCIRDSDIIYHEFDIFIRNLKLMTKRFRVKNPIIKKFDYIKTAFE